MASLQLQLWCGKILTMTKTTTAWESLKAKCGLNLNWVQQQLSPTFAKELEGLMDDDAHR
jgi:hypothetical protein